MFSTNPGPGLSPRRSLSDRIAERLRVLDALCDRALALVKAVVHAFEGSLEAIDQPVIDQPVIDQPATPLWPGFARDGTALCLAYGRLAAAARWIMMLRERILAPQPSASADATPAAQAPRPSRREQDSAEPAQGPERLGPAMGRRALQPAEQLTAWDWMLDLEDEAAMSRPIAQLVAQLCLALDIPFDAALWRDDPTEPPAAAPTQPWPKPAGPSQATPGPAAPPPRRTHPHRSP